MNLKLLVRKQARLRGYLSAILLVMSFGVVQAQTFTVSGKVSGEGEELPGVNVRVKNGTVGVISDVDGNYKIEATSSDVLVYSYIGFKSSEVSVGSRTQIDVSLEPDVQALEEVVIVGYGTQKKKEVTGAVTQLSGDRISAVPTPDLGNALQGQIAGVNVQASSGAPGAAANIQIRGVGSLNANALGPLYVVDGIPYRDNPNIAPSQIATIDVLKDGASAAVYGVRGSNGVIIITTKGGKPGQMRVNFNAYTGIQNITSGTPLMDAHQQFYADEIRTAADNRYPSVLGQNPQALQNNTDFVGDVQNDNASISNYDLNVSGGKDNLTFNANVNYFNQDGVMINSGYDRLSTRLTGNYTSGKFKLFSSIGVTQDNRQREPYGLYENAIRNNPWSTPIIDLPVFGDGVLVPEGNENNYSQLSARLSNTDEAVSSRVNIALRGSYEIVKGLTYEVRLGQNTMTSKRKRFEPKYLVYDKDGNLNEGAGRSAASLREDYAWNTNSVWENVLSYNKDFGKHTLGFTGVLSYERYNVETAGIAVVMSPDSRNSIQTLGNAASTSNPVSNNSTSTMSGKMVRVQYDYDDRYLISANFRYDGTSNFLEGFNKDFFPSVSIGWNVAEEAFFSGGFLDDLRFRASYGTVGNNNIPPYQAVPTIQSGVNYLFGAQETVSSGLIQRTYVDPTVQWETQVSRNVGLDLAIMNNRLQVTADYYINDKEDMLLSEQLPLSSGTHAPGWTALSERTVNVGNMTNKGFELAVSYKNQTNFGLTYSITGTFTTNKNEITRLSEGVTIGYPDGQPAQTLGNVDNTTFFAVGYPAGAFFLVPTDGVIKTQEELDDYLLIDPNARMGDLRYVNTDTTNSEINSDDRVYMGSGMPKFESGININLGYKNFDFAVQGYFSYGAKVYNGAKLTAYARGRHLDQVNMWSPQNPNSDIPVYRSFSHPNVRAQSDQFLEDGTYFRIRTLSLGYNIKSLQNIGIQNIRVYFNSLNPFTFTKYEGYDPEVGGNGLTTRGVDVGSYPITRQFMIGMELSF